MRPVKLSDETLDAMLGIGPDYTPPTRERKPESRDALYNAGQWEVARLSWEETYGKKGETP